MFRLYWQLFFGVGAISVNSISLGCFAGLSFERNVFIWFLNDEYIDWTASVVISLDALTVVPAMAGLSFDCGASSVPGTVLRLCEDDRVCESLTEVDLAYVDCCD